MAPRSARRRRAPHDHEFSIVVLPRGSVRRLAGSGLGGLGDMLTTQVANETEEQRRRRLLALQLVGGAPGAFGPFDYFGFSGR
jgi:hypothetical protein